MPTAAPSTFSRMKIWETVTRLDEMAFRRRAIIDKLRALQPQINAHALKIIAYPDSPEVDHWRRELSAWGNDLTTMQLRGLRGVTSMGFALAWNGLYREPFEGAEEKVLELKLGIIEREYQRRIAKDRGQMIAELKGFLRPFCEAVGRSEFVDSIVQSLGRPLRVPDAAAE
jgi:hypothetical protein